MNCMVLGSQGKCGFVCKTGTTNRPTTLQFKLCHAIVHGFASQSDTALLFDARDLL